MIVTLKLTFRFFKACFSKKGGMGVGALESRPGGERSEPQEVPGAATICRTTTVSSLGIKKGLHLVALLSLQLGENYSANPNLLSKYPMSFCKC